MFGFLRIPWKPLAALCRRVGTALSAGIEIRRVWQRESETGSLHHRRQMSRITQVLMAGDSVTDALHATGDYLPELVHDLVQVGESTGKLDQVFSRLADHYENLIRLRRAFMLGILWPIIQLVIAILVVGLLIWISGWISQYAGQKIDFMGLNLAGGPGVALYFGLVFAGLICLGLIMHGFRRGWMLRTPVYRVLRRIPTVGPWLETLSLANFTWALSLAVEAGLDARKSLQVAIRSAQNPLMLHQARRMDRMIARGTELHAAMRDADVYPPDLLDTVEVGEESGRLDETLRRLSTQLEDQARSQGKVVALVAGLIIWGLVAMLIVALIFRLVFFYRDMLMGEFL